MTKVVGYTASVVGLILLSSVIYVLANFDTFPLDEQVIKDLKIGLSVKEVEGIVPKPTAIQENGKVWIFSRHLSWPIISLRFSEDNKLEEVVIDE